MILCHILMAQLQLQRTQRQVFHAVRTFEEILVEDGVCSLFLTGKDRVSHSLKMNLGLKAVVIVGRTAPEGFLIELYLFDVCPAINHRTKMGITYRQCFQPMRSRLCIP